MGGEPRRLGDRRRDDRARLVPDDDERAPLEVDVDTLDGGPRVARGRGERLVSGGRGLAGTRVSGRVSRLHLASGAGDHDLDDLRRRPTSSVRRRRVHAGGEPQTHPATPSAAGHHPAVSAVGPTFERFFSEQGTHLAAMVAYFALASFVPLIFLALSVLGFLDQADSSSALVGYLEDVFPDQSVESIVRVVDAVQRMRRRCPSSERSRCSGARSRSSRRSSRRSTSSTGGRTGRSCGARASRSST